MHYCSQEKGTGAFLFSGEGNCCSTVLRRKELVLYCSQEKGTGDLLFSGNETVALLFSVDHQFPSPENSKALVPFS